MRLERFAASLVLSLCATATACPSVEGEPPASPSSATPNIPPPPVTISSAPSVLAKDSASAIVLPPPPKIPRPLKLAVRAYGKAFAAHLGGNNFRSEGEANGLVVSPDGAWLALGGRELVTVWDAASGEEIVRFEDGYSPQHMQFGDGHRLLATMSENRRLVRLHDLASRQVIFEVARKSGDASFALSSNGKVLVWEDDETMHVLDVPTMKQRPTFPAEGKPYEFRDLALSSDGKTLYVARGGALRALDLATRAERWKRPTYLVPVIAVDATGKRIAHAVVGGVELVDAASGTPQPPLKTTSPFDSRYLAFSRDGTHVTVSGDSSSGRVFDVGNGAISAVVLAAEYVGMMVPAAPAGDTIFTAWRSGPRRHVTKKGLLLEEIVAPEHACWVSAIGATADGKTIVTGGDDGRVVAWDVASRKGTLVTTVATGLVRSIAVSREGRWVALGGRFYDPVTRRAAQDGTSELVDANMVSFLEVWDLVSSKRTFAAPAGLRRTIQSLSFSADGKQVVASDEQTMRAFSIPSGAQVWKRELPKVDKRWMTFVVDGGASTLMVEARAPAQSGISTTTLAQMDAKTGVEAWSIKAFPVSLAAAPTANRFAYGDGTSCSIGDLSTGKELARQAGSSTWGAGGLALSSDGQRCAFGWDVLTLYEMGKGGRELARHFGTALKTMVFAGKTLATAGTTGVDLWEPGD